MAQFGRALRSGRRGRRFESCFPDRDSKYLVVCDVFAGSSLAISILIHFLGTEIVSDIINPKFNEKHPKIPAF